MTGSGMLCESYSPYGSFWHVNEKTRHADVSGAFSSLRKVMKLKGRKISDGTLSRVILVTVGSRRYYVKTYSAGGKGLRRYVGRSRARSEWENLNYFDKLKIPVPNLVAYGQEVRFGVFRCGALITEELPDVEDMARLARQRSPRLSDRIWVRKVMAQIACYTRRLHGAGFVHVDLKWRNILVTLCDDPKVFFFDSPSGGRQYAFRLKRGIIKDLACLDKVARDLLPDTERLWFYKAYTGHSRLLPADRRMITKILAFFEGRR